MFPIENAEKNSNYYEMMVIQITSDFMDLVAPD
jgi:hypothetical protein